MLGRRTVLLIRSSLLFLLSVLLVMGFYYHDRFYSLGVVPLLLGGGLLTFLVITAARAITGTSVLPRQATVDLDLTQTLGERLRAGTNVLEIAPVTPDVPSVGEVARVRTDRGAEFARLRTADCIRRYVSEVSEDEAQRAGYPSAAAFAKVATGDWGLQAEDVVALIEFEVLEVPG